MDLKESGKMKNMVGVIKVGYRRIWIWLEKMKMSVMVVTRVGLSYNGF